MKYKFPYDEIPELEIPDSIDVKIYSVKDIAETNLNEEEILKKALKNPIKSNRIYDLIDEKSQILIIIDDISRPTPLKIIIPVLLTELLTSGAIKENIQFLIALGTHRDMTEEEIEIKLGKKIAHDYTIRNHGWNKPEELYNYGKLDDGTEVILNKRMHESDFVIGIGGIAPHPAAGFSGGGKIITPGVATESAAGNFHWKSVHVPQKDVLGVRDNPMREQIDKIAKMANLSFILNVIQDGSGKIIEAVAGDPIEAHRIGAKIALQIYGIEIPNPEESHIFIADTHPLDQDLWQGVKAMCALDIIAPDDAVIILVTPAFEGVAPMHPEVLEFGYQSLETVTQLIKEEKLDKVPAHNLVQGGRLVKRTHSFLVSPNISNQEALKLGFRKFTTPSDALIEAIKIKGENSKLIILGLGGEICPIPKN